MPNSKNTFADLGVHKNLVKSLNHEGITSPFPIQVATLPEAIGGRDVLGKGQTGSGKTLAFGLTVLTRLAFQKAEKNRPLALILAPTRELAMQINEVLSLYADSVGLESTVLAGGMPYPPQLKALRNGVQIVVATPGRLQDHMKRKTIELTDIEIVVLDEADQMADMGFLPVVTEVLSKTPEDGQRLLFSATLDRDVDKLVKMFMKDPVTHSLEVTSQREADMDHHVLVVDSHVKEDVISQIASREGRTIFFVRTKRGADKLTEKLKSLGVDVGVLHGGRTQKQRSRVLDAFKLGRKSALIATDVAARGIHVDDVSLVVHVDPPETHKDYLHRAGRTARAGSKGTVVSIASPSNKKRVHRLGREAGVTMSESKVGSLHPDLVRITGASAPSGIPVEDEVVTRSERSKEGRGNRNRPKGRSNSDSKPFRKSRTERKPERAPRVVEEYETERPRREKKEFDSRRPKKRFNSDEPRRKFDSEKPRRKFDDEKPRRKFDSEKPRRKFDDEKPKRKFDSEKPRRRFNEDKPKRKFDSDKPKRLFDDDKPRRRFDDSKPKSRFADEKPKRKFDSDRPKKVNADGSKKKFDSGKPKKKFKGKPNKNKGQPRKFNKKREA